MLQTKDWLKTFEGVEEYLRMFCGVNGTPMPYVARNQIVPTAESEYPSNGYNTTNYQMIASAPIVIEGTVGTIADLEANGPIIASYFTDRATFWGKLNAIFTDSTTWT